MLFRNTLITSKRVISIRTVSIVMLFLLGLAFVNVAYAHLYSGNKWRSMPREYTFALGLSSTFKSEYRAAAGTWNNAPGSYQLNESPTGLAVTTLGASRYSQDDNPDGWYGNTVRSVDSQGYLTQTYSSLNLDYTWYTDGRFPDIRGTMLHELGHNVRLIDSCDAPESVMCYQTTVKRSLSTHDTNELKAVYP